MRIVQFLPNLTYGDAISDFALKLDKIFKSWGLISDIYVKECTLNYQSIVGKYEDFILQDNDLLIYHSSISSDVLKFFVNINSKRKVLIYHSVTPCKYFEGYSQKYFDLLKNTRDELKFVSSKIDLALAVSEFNRVELISLGFDKTDKLPIILDFKRFEDVRVASKKDSYKNILFVGRFSPNKKHDDLIKAFFIYKKYFNKDARLYLVGDYEGMEEYFLRLNILVQKLNLSDSVVMPGHVSFEELVVFYKNSDLFLSMSEHEGFFVPLLESFYFDLPVLAFDSSAVSETMGGAGVLFDEKNYYDVAKKINEIISDEKYRSSIFLKQKERLKYFDADDLEQSLKKILSKYI